MNLLVRSSLRYLLRRPWQFGLAVVGVALGVAVVVSIGLANASASRAFTLSTEAITGRATHQVVGGPRGLPDDAFRRLTIEAGIERAAPVVEDWVAFPLKSALASPVNPATGRRPSRAFHLLGVDPFSEGPFRSYLGPAGGAPRDGSAAVEAGLGALLTRPGTVVMAAGTAAELGLHPGDTFTVRAAGVLRRLELAGTLAPRDADARRAVSDLLLTDIASAQETLGRVGRLDRIDLLLAPGAAGKRELAQAAAVLPAGAQILPAAGRTRTTEEMTRAFRLNLTALSLLALVCGVFLIYNTMTFSVVQRRTWIGTLRALGVSRREIFALVLGEAAVVAVLGTATGLGAGVLLGRGLVRLVTQTISDLYLVVSVRELAVSPSILLLGALLGIGATLLAALVPALEATQAPPRAALLRSTLEGRLRRSLPRATALGFALLALGGILLALPGGLALSFGGLFAVILGFALLTPVATVLLMGLLRRPLGTLLGVLGRMAAGGVVASLSRTAVAIAALVIAVSVTVGIGVMIDSFRQTTVVRWLAMTLQSDVYVAVPSRAGGFAGVDLDPEVARQAMALPGVAGGHTIRTALELPLSQGTHPAGGDRGDDGEPRRHLRAQGRKPRRGLAGVPDGRRRPRLPEPPLRLAHGHRHRRDRAPADRAGGARLPGGGRLLRLRLRPGGAADEPRDLPAARVRPRALGVSRSTSRRGPTPTASRPNCAPRSAANGGSPCSPTGRSRRSRSRSSTAPS